MDRPTEFTKIDLTPRRYHGFNVFLFILGTIFPPLAVAARFGISKDFWLNILLTLCGYVPGQIHNFYIQNIRNNKNHRRTPKWAIRYGLVDASEIRRKEKRSQWAARYNERLPQSALEGQAYEDGQNPSSTPDITEQPPANGNGNGNGALWREEDEGYYGQHAARGENGSLRSGGSGSGRWRYPMNFDDAEFSPVSPTKPKKKSKKKDRFALTEDAHMGIGTESVPKKRKSKKRSKRKGTADDDSSYQRRDSDSRSSIVEPEDAVGGLYGDRRAVLTEPERRAPDTAEERERRDRELFEHQF